VKAELAKLRFLPLPRITLAAQAGLVVLVAAGVAAAGSGADFRDGAYISATVGTTLGTLVLAAWTVGLEYGQKTMRRALTADPRRPRFALNKLVLVVGVVAADTVLVWGLATALAAITAAAEGADSPVHDLVSGGAAFLALNLIYGVVAWAVTLITRSMGGAIFAVLGLGFVIDGLIGHLASVSDYTLGNAATDIAGHIDGGDADAHLLRNMLTTAVWVLGFTAAGLLRFTRTDVR
jgi:ABC-type transport system involved in multi-copper enzyme maturation permease subunit